MSRRVEQREWALHKAMGRESANLQAVLAEVSRSQALEKAFRAMSASVFDAICECDGSGTIIKASRQLQQILGHPFESLVGAPLESFAIAADALQIRRLFELNRLSPGRASRIETTFLKHGSDAEARLTLTFVSVPGEIWNQEINLAVVGCQHRVDDATSGCTAAERSSCVSLNIRFDAATPRYTLIPSSSSYDATCRAQAASFDLLDFFPAEHQDEFDRFVYDAIQSAPVGDSFDSISIYNLELVHPQDHSTQLEIDEAWIHVGSEIESSDNTMPVTMKLAGIREAPRVSGLTKLLASLRPCSDSPGPCDEAGSDVASDFSSIGPDDSISHVALRQRRGTAPEGQLGFSRQVSLTSSTVTERL